MMETTKTTAEQIAEGLLHLHRQHGCCDTAAEHDIIYAGPFDEADRATMEALGWHETQYECWGRFT